MSMAGRMSVFILLAESTPKMAISEQRTAIVYGRRSARRTIHMGVGLGCRSLRCGARAPPVFRVAAARQRRTWHLLRARAAAMAYNRCLPVGRGTGHANGPAESAAAPAPAELPAHV